MNQVVWYPDPQAGSEAKFSLGYCLSRALIEGKVKIDHFMDESIHDANTRKLMQKIKFVVIEVSEQDLKENPFGYQEVVSRMNDGNVYSCKVNHAKGEPQNPHTDEEFSAKFMDNARYAHYAETVAKQIQTMILSFEEVEDAFALGELLGQ